MRETRTEEPGHTPADLELPLGPPPPAPGALRRLARAPLVRLALYYALLLGVAAVLIAEFPLVRRALVTPSVPMLGEGASILTGESSGGWSTPPAMHLDALERALTTLLVVSAAIALAVPVAWIYMLTKRLRFDPGLVRSVVILPIAVAGILLVVKNSLAIAFSLAGIVAAVRFRNTLKDPRDAVYIFLTIAIGIAAGVQALDVALVVSVVFNLAVFTLWKFQVGSLQAGRYGRTGVLSIGDPALLVGQSPEACEAVRRHVVARADGLKVDGVLLVHTSEPEVTRHAVLEALRQNADDWQVLGVVHRGAGLETAEYLVELDKKAEPADLLGSLADWSARIAAAEFIPFHGRRRPRKAEEDDDGEDD
jgi:hypothetical protein